VRGGATGVAWDTRAEAGAGADPGRWALSASPNPFRSETTIRFQLGAAGPVTLRVFDVAGREVATLERGQLAAGPHAYLFREDGRASGIYFYRLETPVAHGTGKVMRMR